jgi:hypothetical protein
LNISGLKVVDRRGKLAIFDCQHAGSDLVLEIARDAGDAVGGTRLVKALARLRHAVGDADHGAQGRDAGWSAQEAHEIPAETQELRLDVMVIGVEGKDLLGLRLAFLLDDVWRSQPSPSSSRSRPACMVLDRQSA